MGRVNNGVGLFIQTSALLEVASTSGRGARVRNASRRARRRVPRLGVTYGSHSRRHRPVRVRSPGEAHRTQLLAIQRHTPGDGVLHHLRGRPSATACCLRRSHRIRRRPDGPWVEAPASGDHVQRRRDRTGFGRTSFFVRSFLGIIDRRSRIGSRVGVPSCLGRDAGRSSEAGRSARQVKCCPSGVRAGPEDVSGTISFACVVPLPTRAGKCFSMLELRAGWRFPVHGGEDRHWDIRAPESVTFPEHRRAQEQCFSRGEASGGAAAPATARVPNQLFLEHSRVTGRGVCGWCGAGAITRARTGARLPAAVSNGRRRDA
jgi:hypothetical protein